MRAALASDATGPKVRRQVEAGLMNTQLREKLAGQLGERLAEGHQILGRWAVALTASETYAEIFDQHVELYGRVGGLLQFLREGYRQTDPRGFRGRARREYSSPGGEAEDEWFVDNLVGTINIGASLEDATWDLALRVLPQAWWDRRTTELAAAAGLVAQYRLQNADPYRLEPFCVPIASSTSRRTGQERGPKGVSGRPTGTSGCQCPRKQPSKRCSPPPPTTCRCSSSMGSLRLIGASPLSRRVTIER